MRYSLTHSEGEACDTHSLTHTHSHTLTHMRLTPRRSNTMRSLACQPPCMLMRKFWRKFSQDTRSVQSARAAQEQEE
jgi:hypothetical protein